MPAPHPVPGDPSDPDDMPMLVSGFCDWLAVRGYSSRHTIDRYHVSLALFTDWAAERGVTQPREVTRPVVEGYQRARFHLRQPSGKPLTFRSQTARLVALRQLFRWLAQGHRVLVNPTAELELPRVPRWQPRSAMTVAEAEDVLAQPNLSTPDGVHDRAVLEVFYSTAMRASELASLQVFDLDVARSQMAVNPGKGGRSRVAPIAVHEGCHPGAGHRPPPRPGRPRSPHSAPSTPTRTWTGSTAGTAAPKPSSPHSTTAATRRTERHQPASADTDAPACNASRRAHDRRPEHASERVRGEPAGSRVRAARVGS